MIDEIKKYASSHSLPNGINLYALLQLFNKLNNLEDGSTRDLSFEEFREKYIYNWRLVPCSAFSDPNEGWYYQWLSYKSGELT